MAVEGVLQRGNYSVANGFCGAKPVQNAPIVRAIAAGSVQQTVYTDRTCTHISPDVATTMCAMRLLDSAPFA